jgi:hypothetical protein
LGERLWTLEHKAVLSFLFLVDSEGKRPINLLSTLAHHPSLLDVFLLMATRLGLEILALRTAWRAKSVYEREHHYSYGLKAGLTKTDMAGVCIT